MERFSGFFEESGATLVEYGLLIALVALVLVAILTVLGGSLAAAMCPVTTILGGTCP